VYYTVFATEIKFFTADIKAKIATHGQDANEAQQSYHRALEKCYPDTIEIIKGYTLYMKNLSKPTYLGCFLIFLR